MLPTRLTAFITTQAEQTKKGEFEFIEYHTFKWADYDRLMSWKGGEDGRIGFGTTTRPTDKPDTDVLLPRRWNVVVDRTTFKLVPKP